MAQISARFPDEIRTRLKVCVAQNDSSIQEVLEDAILEYLESHGEDIAELRRLVEEYRATEGKSGDYESRRTASGE